jgi:hypothetical protein
VPSSDAGSYGGFGAAAGDLFGQQLTEAMIFSHHPKTATTQPGATVPHSPPSPTQRQKAVEPRTRFRIGRSGPAHRNGG